MTSNKYHPDPDHLSPSKNNDSHHIYGEFTIDDEESLHTESSYMKAQESRRMLREMTGKQNGTPIKPKLSDEIKPEDTIIKSNDTENGFCTRVWIRILVALMLLSYISTMITWVSKMRHHSHYHSADEYSIDMSNICSLPRLKTGDDKQCKDICDPYRCCWDLEYREEKQDHCLEKFDVAFCAQFLPCRNLLISFNDTSDSN